MDVAVGLVEAYLRVNGYFTVTEFPLVERGYDGKLRALTDFDLLACRFPEAHDGGIAETRERAEVDFAIPDPLLETPRGAVDMIVAEVKEARARFNKGGLREDALGASLARFGCCPPGAPAEEVVRELRRRGRSVTPVGHALRLVAFGATVDPEQRPYLQIPLGRVIDFLRRYLQLHREALTASHPKDTILGLLLLMEKAGV